MAQRQKQPFGIKLWIEKNCHIDKNNYNLEAQEQSSPLSTKEKTAKFKLVNIPPKSQWPRISHPDQYRDQDQYILWF